MWQAKVRDTRWFYGYQSSAKALIKVEMQGFGGVLVVLCIEGGLITQVEAEEMQRIANEAKQDAAKTAALPRCHAQANTQSLRILMGRVATWRVQRVGRRRR